MANVKTVKFRNYSDETFIGFWNSEKYTFKPGAEFYMEEWKASHFAKHLANRELQKRGMVMDTSPKRPMDNPRFMELFNKAFVEEEEEVEEMSEEKATDEILNKNLGNESAVTVESGNEDEEDDDEDDDAPLSPSFSDGQPSMPASLPESDDDSFEGKNA